MKEKQIIYPGTVFTAKHYDQFKKSFKVHPFVCIYNQSLDPSLDTESNVIGLLITSNNKQSSKQVSISRKKNPFLDKDSYCYCFNLYTFSQSDISQIGTLDSETFFNLIQKRQLLLRGENDQCVQALMNMKSFESKKQVETKFQTKIEKIKKVQSRKEKKKSKKKKEKSVLETSYFPNKENTENYNPSKRNISLIDESKVSNDERQKQKEFRFENDVSSNSIDDYINTNLYLDKKDRVPFYSKKKKK